MPHPTVTTHPAGKVVNALFGYKQISSYAMGLLMEYSSPHQGLDKGTVLMVSTNIKWLRDLRNQYKRQARKEGRLKFGKTGYRGTSKRWSVQIIPIAIME
jgi:hypothetical protein